MQKVGYSLIDENNNEIEFWGDNLSEERGKPSEIFLPNGSVVHSPELNVSYLGYTLVERWIDGDASKIFLKQKQTKSFNDNKIIITWEYRNPTKQEYSDAVQKIIESTALNRGYLDSVTLCSYINSTNLDWKKDAETFIAWRDLIWNFVFQRINNPNYTSSISDLIVGLPAIQW